MDNYITKKELPEEEKQKGNITWNTTWKNTKKIDPRKCWRK